MLATPGRRRPETLIILGTLAIMFAALQMALTDTDTAAWGTATGGAIVILVGITLPRARNRTK